MHRWFLPCCPLTRFVTVTPRRTAGGALSPAEALCCQALLSPRSGRSVAPQELWGHLSAVCPPSPRSLSGLAQPGRAVWFRVLSHLLSSCSRLCRMCDSGRCGWQEGWHPALESPSCTGVPVLPCPQGQHLGPIPQEAPVVSPAGGCGGQAGVVSLKWFW